MGASGADAVSFEPMRTARWKALGGCVLLGMVGWAVLSSVAGGGSSRSPSDAQPDASAAARSLRVPLPLPPSETQEHEHAQEAAEEEQQPQPARINSPPHVLLILADDYGWANLGAHRRTNNGSPEARQALAEVHTPNLDALIDEGVLLDRHYAYKICSPSRSSLQSGRLAVHVNSKNTGVTHRNLADPVSGFAGIPTNMTGIAQKLKEAGYRTHMVGKWDAGMATPAHSPLGRGYETFFGYYQHANDYWTEGTPFQATGEIDNCLNAFTDFSMYNSTYVGGVTDEIARSLGCVRGGLGNREQRSPWAASGLAASLDSLRLDSDLTPTGCSSKNASDCLSDACYEESMLRAQSLSIIRAHDASSPLFLFHSFHLLHTPLQIPRSYLDKIDQLIAAAGAQEIDSENRRLYAAMAMFMDDVVGDLVAALKSKKMYDNTLIIFTSDNGGPIYEPGAANNHPLRGGKYSDWEGGVRTNAFVSGGFVPQVRRGSRFQGIVSIADWYGTLCLLAGVTQEDSMATKANEWLSSRGLPLLPPVDSVPQWEHIVGDTNGRKETLHLSEFAVLRWPYKLVAGRQLYGTWQGELYPNCSTITNFSSQGPYFHDVKLFGEPVPLSPDEEKMDQLIQVHDCGGGCLFDVSTDPGEHVDLASDPSLVTVLGDLKRDLASLNKGIFTPDRGALDLQACLAAIDAGGFYGPFVDIEGFYTPVTVSPLQEAKFALERFGLEALNRTLDAGGERLLESLVKGVVKLEKWFPSITTYDKCRPVA